MSPHATVDPERPGSRTRPAELEQRKQTAARKSLMASTVGNLLEYYEWSAYAVFAPFIAKAMFNSSNQVSALLSTLAVFAVGFLARPLGGLFFGWVGDRRGRKFVLIATMLMMAGGSLAIGLLPTYAVVGAWASMLLLLCRVVQGFAHGGEAAAANTYVAELAPPNRRGMWGSVVFVAVIGGSVIAYGLAGGITSVLSSDAVSEWGWRIPFLLGAVFAVVVLYLRRDMDETDVFEDAVEAEETLEASTEPIAEGPKRNMVRRVLLVIALVSGLTTTHYTWSSYVSTYAITHEGMDADAAFWAIMGAQIIALITIPFWGLLSDRIGRRPLWLGFAVTMAVLAIPLRAVISDNAWSLFIPATIALVLVCGPGSILASTMSEAFPTKARTRGIGLAYSLSIAAFGGSAPYLNALFLDIDLGWLGAAYLTALCLFTLAAALIMRETRGIDLREA